MLPPHHEVKNNYNRSLIDLGLMMYDKASLLITMILTGLHSVLLILSHSYFFYQYLLELDQHSMSVKYELNIARKSIDSLK